MQWRLRPELVRRLVTYLVFVVFVLGAVWAVAARRHQLADAMQQLNWYVVLGSLAFAYLAVGAMFMSWAAAIHDGGVELSLKDAGRIYCVGQVGKYLPGSVWPVLMQAQLARRRRVSAIRMASGSLLALAVSVCVGLLVGCALLPFSGASATSRLWWAPLVALPMLVCLHPAVLNWLVRTAARLLRRGDVESSYTLQGVLRSAGWSVIGNLLFGVHILFLGDPLGVTGWRGYLLSVCAYALASSIGVIIVFAPAGAGAREAVLTAALAPVLSVDAAILIALVSRAILITVDVTLAASQVYGLRHLDAVQVEPDVEPQGRV